MGFVSFVPGIGNITPPLPVIDGGIGATTAAAGLANLGGLGLQATTGAAGFALQNGTPNILTWTAPNDGNLHRVVILGNLIVTSAETGGAIGVTNLTSPSGANHSPGLSAGGVGVSLVTYTQSFFVEAGTTVTLAQTSALTAGAAVFWADIWGI